MSRTSKISERYLNASEFAKDIPFDAVRYLPADALQVDVNRRCWINPTSKTVGPYPGCPFIVVRRTCDGFEVSFQSIRTYTWDTQIRPGPLGNLYPWMPVEAILDVIQGDL